MKILITNDSLAFFTGTESWVYAMVQELKKKHQVSVFANTHGAMSHKMVEHLVPNCDGDYDLAIVNHTTTYHKVPLHIPKIFTTHSAVFDIEQPPKGSNWVGINESLAKGNPIIRNGIDCTRFTPSRVNEEVKNILYFSNPNYSSGKRFVTEALEGYQVHTLEAETFEIEYQIEKADVVISMARGALEAMASGKNVIYGDWRQGWMNTFMSAGMVTEENFEAFKRGELRELLRPYTQEELKEELKKYDPKRGQWLREQILKDFNITKTAQQYLDLYGHIPRKI